ncbi:MAG: hypothetical protein FWF90_04355 [Promicromonosporaceae bacterium]|nr:hypothetical protein [Promicromonosporaceae bacterium]
MITYLAVTLAAATPAPSPSPAQQLDENSVSPGIVGFIATFLLVLVAIGLIQLMSRSLRRTAHNARAQGLEVVEPVRVGRGMRLPLREPEEAPPGLLDGGTPFEGAGTTPDDGAAKP